MLQNDGKYIDYWKNMEQLYFSTSQRERERERESILSSVVFQECQIFGAGEDIDNVGWHWNYASRQQKSPKIDGFFYGPVITLS